MIDLSLLEQLVTLSACQTLSETAKQLHISQPALSRSMKKLEDYLGIQLFERSKNRITLNEIGETTAIYAKKLLQAEQEMIAHIRALDRKRYTLAFGSCALTPINKLLPFLTTSFEGMTISSALQDENTLIQGLEQDLYHFIILSHPLDEIGYCNIKWDEEHLLVTVLKDHPLAQHKELHLSDLNGCNILLYAGTGFWDALLRKALPDTHFISHNEYHILDELTAASIWPRFKTTQTLVPSDIGDQRVSIPIVDKEVNVEYFCICKEKNRKILEKFFAQVSASNTSKYLL